MSGLFSQVSSLGAEPVYPGNEFSFSSSYSRGKQSMSSCVLQQLLANKTVLVQFFPGSLHRNLRWHKSFFYRDLAVCPSGKSLHWMLAVVSRFFNTVLLYFAWNSFCSASSTLFFYSWWAPIAWNSFYKPAFDRLLPMEIVLLSGVLRSRRSTVQDGTRRKSSQSLE